jgi:hypothetical protein
VASGVDLEEILQYSLNHLDGTLDIQKLYGIFKEKHVPHHWLQETLREAEGKEYILAGKSYRVRPRGRGIGRRLEPTT